MKLFIHIFLILFSIINIKLTTADTTSLEKPPASLAQWYKPVNKRQVWLHTMFKLRREMQAMREYAEQEDSASMEKWVTGFAKHYKEIVEMVPEWKDKIKPALLSDLKKFTKNQDFYHIALTLNKIHDTCDSCHKDYQSQVTAIYRSPDYSEILINDIDGYPQDIENNMQDLSMYVNQILIALADGHNKRALIASKNLDFQLKNLAKICSDCHKDDKYPVERILGKNMTTRLEKLQNHIELNQVKDSQKLMGEIAVTVCSRCHNTHRIISDLRKTLMPEKILSKSH